MQNKLVTLARRAFRLFQQKEAGGAALLLMLLLVSVFGIAFPAAGAQQALKESKTLNLEEGPLDVVQSDDGQWIFMLSSDAVLVYSASENAVTQRIPVGQGFDRMSFSNKSNSLVLTSSAQKTARILQLEVVHTIDVSGNPFKGSKEAPVTIAVFSDYQ
jgi:hypothetical protein